MVRESPGLRVEEEGDVQVMDAWVVERVRRRRMAEERVRAEEVGRILELVLML